MRTLVPDFVFDRAPSISPAFLREQNIAALLCDVDNTLSPYEDPLPNEEIRAWVKNLQASGIRLALVSNNHRERIELYNSVLGLVAYFDAKKPSRKFYKKAIADLGVPPAECAVLGDQLLTDCWSARRMGLRCLIVPPIRDKQSLFFRCKRLLEVPFMKAYDRKKKRYANKT